MGKEGEADGAVFMQTHGDFTETELDSFQTDSSKNGGGLREEQGHVFTTSSIFTMHQLLGQSLVSHGSIRGYGPICNRSADRFPRRTPSPPPQRPTVGKTSTFV